MAEQYSTRPSLFLGIPPSDDWLAYCVDEAVFLLAAGHYSRDRAWEERFRREPGDERSSYQAIMADPRSGRPPSQDELRMLAAASNGH